MELLLSQQPPEEMSIKLKKQPNTSICLLNHDLRDEKIEMASHDEENKCTGKSNIKETKRTSNRAQCQTPTCKTQQLSNY